MNAVIGAIFENLKEIEIIFDATYPTFTKDTKNTGDIKEITVSQFLSSFFPTTYTISKGKIYNKDNESQEIDCVIKSSIHPRLLTPKRNVILAEGVYAAVEVKPDITTLTEKSEFSRGLKQIKSVKNLKRVLPVLFNEGTVPEAFHRIPSVIFSKKSNDLLKTIDYLKDQVIQEKISNLELPDVIFSLDNGIIFHSLHIEKTIFSEWVKQQSNIHYGEKYLIIESSGKESLLGLFILMLLCFKGPVPEISEFFLIDYLKFGIPSEIRFLVIEP